MKSSNFPNLLKMLHFEYIPSAILVDQAVFRTYLDFTNITVNSLE